MIGSWFSSRENVAESSEADPIRTGEYIGFSFVHGRQLAALQGACGIVAAGPPQHRSGRPRVVVKFQEEEALVRPHQDERQLRRRCDGPGQTNPTQACVWPSSA